MSIINYVISFLIIVNTFISAQTEAPIKQRFSDFQISSEKYMTDDKGNILMYINVWGNVKNPGRHLVYDGVDLATLFSVVGGPSAGANMSEVRLYRESPSDWDQLIYEINMEKFIKSGNRSDFIKLKPNDTIVVKQKFSSMVLSQIGTVSTLLNLITLYFTLESRFK